MMNNDLKHTPTPWVLDTEDVLCITNGKTRRAIAVIHGTRPSNYADKQEEAYCLERVANAEHIVKCVNENEALHARIEELENVIKELNYCEVYMTHEFNSLKPVIEAFSRRFGGNEVSRLTETDDEEDCFENYHESGRKHQKMCDNILKKV